MIEVQGVSQYFRSGFWLRPVQVLFEVNLDIPKGSVIGFVGANGAGKTTLIQLVAGIRKPSRGQVKIGGVEAWRPEAKARVGFLPERPYFHEHLTAEGILSYFGTLSGMRPSFLRDRVQQVLRQVGLADAQQLELRKFSKGMLQRIGIAQAILHDPDVLILDEPLSGLDPRGRDEVRRLIQDLGAQGRTVFFSSHILTDVEAICQQTVMIEKGRLVREFNC